MSGAIEAIHIFDEANKPILSHTYAGRPLPARHVLPLYLAQSIPRPPLVYLPNTSPPTLVFSLVHAPLLFLLTTTTDLEPLLALEFLHRMIDTFEDFLGAPLTAIRLESSYDVCAQLLAEMIDAGSVNTTENNQLRELVEVEGWMGKLLGSIALPSKSGFAPSNNLRLGAQQSSMQAISSHPSSFSQAAPTVPWRRSNVRHTSNELYVDLIETLHVTVAPSGRPLAASAHGTIAFTAKISGVPDLLLTLTAPSGKHNLASVMELPVFHPCVRLARWHTAPGELSFIPPDGRFVLAGYEVDLLPFTSGKMAQSSANLKMPVGLEVKTGLGRNGAEFEVQVSLSKIAGANGNSSSASSVISSLSSSLSNASRPGGPASTRGPSSLGQGMGTQASPLLEDLIISVPIPRAVRTLSDIRPSRGEATYSPGDETLEWRIGGKETGIGIATLRCTVISATEVSEANSEDDEQGEQASGYDDGETGYGYNSATYNDYSPTTTDQNNHPKTKNANKPIQKTNSGPDPAHSTRLAQNKLLMPTAARASFAVKGWLPSGIRVESLVVDTKRSRGLGEGIKPYKGVKYLCVSRGGVEVRC